MGITLKQLPSKRHTTGQSKKDEFTGERGVWGERGVLSRRPGAVWQERSLAWTVRARGQDTFQDVRNPNLLLTERVVLCEDGNSHVNV
jgi:hypothetical protein